MKFTDFELSEAVLDGLRDVQFDSPTPIQKACIPEILAGRDILATAQTGTGKTGAFAIPVLEQVYRSGSKGLKALILSPTRELAQQIEEQIFAIGYHTGLTTVSVIGGSDFAAQARALKGGVDIVVATPGRLMDQKKVSELDFASIEYFVLDEADRMLDMGFLPDIKKIISWLPEKRQSLLFSATMPKEIARLAEEFMVKPFSVDIARSKPNQNVTQFAYKVDSEQKVLLVRELLHQLRWESCIMFTSTKRGTDQLYRLLKKEGIQAVSIHGDRSQEERNVALQDFINGKVPVIVATDVLARGIDIKGVSMIINFDMPHSTDDYVHRIGRTGRYDRTGIAVTFATRRDAKSLRAVQDIKDNKLTLVEVPQEWKGGEGLDLGFSEELLLPADERQSIDRKGAKPAAEGTRRAESRRAESPSEKPGEPRKSRGDSRSRTASQEEGRSLDKGREEAPPAERPARNGEGPPREADQEGARGNGRGRQSDSGGSRGRDRTRGTDRTGAGRTRGDDRTGTDRNGAGRRGEPAESRSNGRRGSDRASAAPSPEALELKLVEKAVRRSGYRRSPKKGVRGILLSFIPKISRN